MIVDHIRSYINKSMPMKVMELNNACECLT